MKMIEKLERDNDILMKVWKDIGILLRDYNSDMKDIIKWE